MPYAEQNGAQKTTLSSGQQYALALLRGREGADMLRITLWGEHAFEEAAALVSHLAGHPLLVVDSQSYTVQSVSLSQHPWASQATWADLMLSRNDRLLGLRFVSPMLLHHSTDESEDLVFPEPLAVFSQLQKRWMDLRGPSLTCHLHAFLEQGGCVVSDYRLLEFTQFCEVGELRG